MKEKSGRETLDNDGTDTKRERCNTVPFPGNNCRSLPYHRTATMGAAAPVCVKKRGDITRNDDIEQSLKVPIRADVRSIPYSREECWSEQTLEVTCTGPLTNKEVQSRKDIKAEESDGPCSENATLFAGQSIARRRRLKERGKSPRHGKTGESL